MRSFAWFVFGVGGLVAVAVVALREGDADAPTATAPAATTTAGTDDSTGWRVVFVADGDTLEVTGPDGRHIVRLAGINAPETGECGADDARRELRAVAGDGEVSLVRDQTDRDSFGRLVRYVGTPGGVDVGAALVERGWALARHYWPDTARNDAYDELEQAARSAGAGLWAPTGCGAVAPGVAVSVEIHADAAGRDDENLTDEWVRFTNDGSDPLDLDGWIVADESSSNRYTFDAVVLAPAASVRLVTGCGVDDATTRHWCRAGFPIWNNDGDTVFLRDAAGNDVLAVDY